MHSDQNPEEDLLPRLREGSIDAFERIFKLYWKPLYRYAKVRLRSHEEAEEVIQQLFSTLWEKRRDIAMSSLPVYLYSAVHHRIVNRLRSTAVRQRYAARRERESPDFSTDTENEIITNELAAVVDAAIEKLPVKSRLIFVMSRFEGKSKGEIATSMSLSEKAIEYHLTRSLEKLRCALKSYLLLSAFGIFF